jgi:hypothetical protein
MVLVDSFWYWKRQKILHSLEAIIERRAACDKIDANIRDSAERSGSFIE